MVLLLQSKLMKRIDMHFEMMKLLQKCFFLYSSEEHFDSLVE